VRDHVEVANVMRRELRWMSLEIVHSPNKDRTASVQMCRGVSSRNNGEEQVGVHSHA